MRSPEEIENYLKTHWFTTMCEAHKTRDYLRGIFKSTKFVFRIPVLNKNGISTINEKLITFEDAINFIKL